MRSDLETEPKQCNAKGEIVDYQQLKGPGGSGTTVDTSTGRVGEVSAGISRYSQSPKKVPQEASPFEFLMANLRDPSGYLLMDEKRTGLTKKKFFVANEARAMHSRINLKFPEMENKN